MNSSNNNNNKSVSSSFRNGRSSMRRSTIASHRPSLVLSDVFPHTDVEKQITVHHERVFEGMVEDVLLTEQETEKEEQQTTEQTQKTEDDLIALMEDDDIDIDAPSSSRRVRRHSSYESRRRRQGMQDHNKMKQALPKKNKEGSRMELLEHLHDISMDLSQMMKSSTTMSISGGGGSSLGGEEETLAESCPVLSYIMEDDEDMAELTHGRRRRNLRRLRSRRRRERGISVIPEDDQQQQRQEQSSSSSTPPADDNDDDDELKSYTMELPEESEDEDVEQKPRAYRAPKISSYHLLMTSMQMADNMNDVTSIMESFSSLHSSSKDVMNFPSPSSTNLRKNPAPFPTTPEERYVASLTAPGGAASSEADKPGQMPSATTALAMGQHPMVPASGIARGPIARGA